MPVTGTAIAAWADTAAGTATLVGVGTTLAGAALSKAMAPSMPAAPPPPPAMPTVNSPVGEAAAAGVANKAAGAAGISSTNLTGPQGLTTPATTAQKTLLGS